MKSFKKILLITAIMAMMFALVAINASAGTIRIKSDNTCTAELDDGTASYDADTNTLTLEDVKITANSVSAIDLYNSGDTTLVVKGTCELTSAQDGIYSDKANITIVCEDNASLKITSTGAYGIYSNGSITFSGKDIIDIETKVSCPAVKSSKDIEFNLTAGAKVHAKTLPGSVAFSTTHGHIVLTSGVITLPENGVINDGSIEKKGEQGGVIEATVELKAYDIETPVADLTWVKGCCDVLSIKVDTPITNFDEKVVVDGEVVSDEHYVAMSGSTIVMFRASYLENLAVGDHTVEIFFKDGTAKGTFTIVDEEKTTTTEEDQKIAQTSDNNAIALFVATGVLSAAGFVSLKKKEN